MMNFLANENFPLFSIQLLRNAGFKVISILEETPGASDRDILTRAHKENFIVLTFDKDYGELIYKHKFPAPAGILFFRFAPSSPKEPDDILLEILKENNVLIPGKFTVLERNRLRQRPLSEIGK